MAVLRSLILVFAVVCTQLPLFGATLEKLSMDEMIQKSTSIVRCRVADSHAMKRGPVIYTLTRVQVLERWKGPEASSIEVAIPGGLFHGLRQEFSGVPALKPGGEYVLFLWTGSSGVTYVIGLSQGVFHLTVNENGEEMVERAVSGAVVLDPKTHRPVAERAVSLRLSDLRGRVRKTLARARQ